MGSGHRLENPLRDLDPRWFAEQIRKVFPTFLNVCRLAVFDQSIPTGPLFDEGEFVGMIQIDKKIVLDASVFEPCRGDEGFKHAAQLLLFPWLGVDVSDDIDFDVGWLIGHSFKTPGNKGLEKMVS
jgi:hypothetical protein